MKIQYILAATLFSTVSYNAMASSATCATAQAGDPNDEVDELAIYTTWWMSDATILGTPAYVIVANNPAGGSVGHVSGSVRTNINGAYDDCIIVSGNATVGADLRAYAGNDTFRLSGNAVIGGSILAAEGNDDVEIGGNASVGTNVDLGNGTNTLLMSANAEVLGNVIGGTGYDYIEMTASSTIAGTITTGDGGDVIHLRDVASVADINMGNGSDSLMIVGPLISLGGSLNGGDDASTDDGYIDSLSFNGWSGNAPVMTNWERIRLNAAHLNFGTSSYIHTEEFYIGNASSVTATGATHEITGNIENSGIIDMSDGNATGNFIIGGNYMGSGTLNLDIDLANEQSDKITVSGDVNANGTLDFTRVGGDHDG
ncbi:MAG: hypothetical protein ACK5LE_02670, partial [Alphaproteobacteria bacterium]